MDDLTFDFEQTLESQQAPAPTPGDAGASQGGKGDLKQPRNYRQVRAFFLIYLVGFDDHIAAAITSCCKHFVYL